MKIADRTVLLCDCDGTMPLEPVSIGAALAATGLVETAAAPQIHQRLCCDEIGSVRQTVAQGARCLIACTQEIRRFREAAGDTDALDFVNIRETAGWSAEAAQAAPKIAALLATAAIEAPEPELVELQCAGRVLVHGHDQAALAAAQRLAERLTVTLILAPEADVLLPGDRAMPIEIGRARSAAGVLGAFSITFDRHGRLAPWSRDKAEPRESRDNVVRSFDLVLDLSGGVPWFRDHVRRLGYARPDPRRPEAVERALHDLEGLVGTIAKPRYVAHESSLCAHASGQQIGCTKCIDACPTGAVSSIASAIAVDPAVCAGCGSCVAACPTEAMSYAAPASVVTRRRVAMLLGSYLAAGGERPILLLHSTGTGEAMLAALARLGPGLPANVLPLGLRQPTQLGLDMFATAFALGALKIVVQCDAEHADEAAAMRAQLELADAAMSQLGWGDGRATLLVSADPDALLEATADDQELVAIPAIATLDPQAPKHESIRASFDHLAAARRASPCVLSAGAGMPFGTVIVSDACTVCLACTRSCPTGALSGDARGPTLAFEEASCVQCGLCAAVCPEHAITLEPRLLIGDERLAPRTLKRDEPAICQHCGAPFGSRATIARVTAKLRESGWDKQNAGLIGRLLSCETCRVTAPVEAWEHSPS